MHAIRTWAALWGDIASLAGLIISVVGFLLTLHSVRRSRSAAEGARRAAEQTRASLLHVDAIADLSAAISVMEEIKRLQRESAWRIVPDRYSSLRQKLIRIRNTSPDLSEDDGLAIAEATGQFAELEQRVERFLAKGAAPPNPAKLNEAVGAQLDRVEAILVALQRRIRRPDDG